MAKGETVTINAHDLEGITVTMRTGDGVTLNWHGRDTGVWYGNLAAALKNLQSDIARTLEFSAANPHVVAMLEERREQVMKHKYTDPHDDAHRGGELARLAAFFALPDGNRGGEAERLANRIYPDGWSLMFRAKKSGKTRVAQLHIAGACILAELARLDREAKREREQERGGTARVNRTETEGALDMAGEAARRKDAMYGASGEDHYLGHNDGPGAD